MPRSPWVTVSRAADRSKTGTWTQTLSGANSYGGGTTLNAGTLVLNNATALGTVAGTLTINGGDIGGDLGGQTRISRDWRAMWKPFSRPPGWNCLLARLMRNG